MPVFNRIICLFVIELYESPNYFFISINTFFNCKLLLSCGLIFLWMYQLHWLVINHLGEEPNMAQRFCPFGDSGCGYIGSISRKKVLTITICSTTSNPLSPHMPASQVYLVSSKNSRILTNMTFFYILFWLHLKSISQPFFELIFSSIVFGPWRHSCLWSPSQT